MSQNPRKNARADKKFAMRRLTVCAVLSAMSAALMYLEFSLPFVPDFLKFDFSDLPALIASLAYGPIAGVLIELIKNVIHMPASTSGFVGELANFLLGCAFVVPAGLIYKAVKTKKGALIGTLVGCLCMGALCLPVNYYVTYPVYETFIPLDTILRAYQVFVPFATTLWRALICVNLPFTLCKGLISVVITFAVYKRLSPFLHATPPSPTTKQEASPDDSHR